MGTESEQGNTETQPHKLGFFERRWRMVKAGASKVFEYLISPKTYLMAAAIFGGAALAGQYGVGYGGETIADMFGMGGAGGAVPEKVLGGMAKAVVIGTVFNAVISVFQAGRECDNCDAAVAQAQNQAASPERGRGQQQNYDYAAMYPEGNQQIQAPNHFPPKANPPQAEMGRGS